METQIYVSSPHFISLYKTFPCVLPHERNVHDTGQPGTQLVSAESVSSRHGGHYLYSLQTHPLQVIFIEPWMVLLVRVTW